MDSLNLFQNSIGQHFKVVGFTGGLVGGFDRIVRVDEVTGIVIGEIIEAHHLDCRLKREQPEHLKKYSLTKSNKGGNQMEPKTRKATQDDLDQNPDLAAEGVKPGDDVNVADDGTVSKADDTTDKSEG